MGLFGIVAVDVPEARCLGLHTPEIILDTPTQDAGRSPRDHVCSLSMLVISSSVFNYDNNASLDEIYKQCRNWS